MILDCAGLLDDAAEIMFFPVAGAYLMDGFQGLGQGLLEDRKGRIFVFLELLDPLAEDRGEVDDNRIGKQDQQRDLPVHDQQDNGHADDREHGDQQFADRAADKFIDRAEVGHEIGGHRAAAQGFIFRHGDPVQTGEQLAPYPIDNVLGDDGKLPGLQHIQAQRGEAQKQRHQQDKQNKECRPLPGRGGQRADRVQDHAGPVQQHFIHQQRHQQRHGHARQRGDKRDDIGADQLALVLSRDAEQVLPVIFFGITAGRGPVKGGMPGLY